jgi:hypothetical protein
MKVIFIIITLIAVISLVISPIVFAKKSKNKSVKSPTHISSLCENPEYTCHTVKRGNTWEKLFPDPEQRDLVMRINRMNIKLYPGLKIAVPNTEDYDIMNYSPFPTQIDPPGKKTIIVSINKLAFGAYDSNGELEHWGPISAARGYCPDINRRCTTTLGKFKIYHKGGQSCVSTRYPVGRGGAPMPYCMFFNGNYALHGSYEVPGYNASHGCVRLFVKDAKWLNQEFSAGNSTRVLVNN